MKIADEISWDLIYILYVSNSYYELIWELYEISYRRAVWRKANLEVTGEEKPKTRLSRRNGNKRLCREKKPVWALPDEEKPVSLVSDEKKPVCAVLGRKLTTNDISREKKNRNLLAKILWILLISRTRNLESIYWQFPVHHRLWTSV